MSHIQQLFENEIDKFESSFGKINEKLLSVLVNKFGGNIDLALKEANNDYYIAVIKLAEQLEHLNEVRVKHVMETIGKSLERCIKDFTNIDALRDLLIFTIGKSSNSEEGIISDETSIAPLDQRIITPKQICDILIKSCNYVQDSPKKARQFLKDNCKPIASILIKAIEAGNFQTENELFDMKSYLAAINV